MRKVTVDAGYISRCLMFSFQVKEPIELWNKTVSVGASAEHVFRKSNSGRLRSGSIGTKQHISEIYEPWRHPRTITLNLKSTLISFFSPYISLWLRFRAHKYNIWIFHLALSRSEQRKVFNEGMARNSSTRNTLHDFFLFWSGLNRKVKFLDLHTNFTQIY